MGLKLNLEARYRLRNAFTLWHFFFNFKFFPPNSVPEKKRFDAQDVKSPRTSRKATTMEMKLKFRDN